MIIPLRNPHYGSSWVEAHSVYFSLSLSLEREQGGSIMRRKYFFRARIHARSESRDWNTREISWLRLLVQGYARLFVLVSLLLSPRARFFFFHYVTTERSISISRLGCVFGFSGEMERQTTFPTTNAKRNAKNWAHFEMRARVRNRILSSLSFSGIDRLRRAIRFRISSNFVRIVGKYKGKRNGRGMAIELTRPSLAHTHIHRDILTRFPWHTNHVAVKEKERDKERGSEIVGPRRVTFKSTSADVGFLPVPRYPARLSARQFNEMFERHAKQ